VFGRALYSLFAVLRTDAGWASPPQWRPVACAAGLLFALVVGAHAATREYEVKAAYLFNFANFASWPPNAFESPSAPLRICTVGPDPFGSTLADTVRNETVGGHPLIVVRAPSMEEIRRCHILFVPSDTPDTTAVVAAASKWPVVTVGETDGFLRAGGMLRFAVDEGRVRFDVNPRQATKVGVSLSSKLLQVARQVQQ
jgi:hypothetical protein